MEKLAIMVGGGLDSYVGWFYAEHLGIKNKAAVWVDFGHPYAQKELEAVENFGFPVTVVSCEILRPEFGNLPTEARPFIPGRNALLAQIGATMADKVWLMSLAGDVLNDVGDVGYVATSEYLSRVLRKRVEILGPFTEWTKWDVVKWALNNGVPSFQKTTSCWHRSLWNCGECKACFRRWVALVLNDVEEEFVSHPSKSAVAARLVDEYRVKLETAGFSARERRYMSETLRAVSQCA